MENLFFPGDTRFGQQRGRNRCLWREESFLQHLLSATITPRLSLQACLKQWAIISFDLRESHRTRRLQISELEQKIVGLS